MSIKRFFDNTDAKGSEQYIKTQTRYELVHTLVLFGISLSLFFAGYIQTKQRGNLLTIVAVLGCLPASKRLVSFIMYARYRSCSAEAAAKIKQSLSDLKGLFDCVFTSYKTNYYVEHLAVRGNTICGYSSKADFPEAEFQKHITEHLKLEGHKDLTVKVFTDPDKYCNRLTQMAQLPEEEEKTLSVLETLKQISL